MAFLDKLNSLAKTAGEKTSNAIEITKLNARILKERERIAEAKQGIGEVYYARIADGYELLPEAAEYGDAIKAAEAAIVEAQEAIALIKTGGDETVEAPAEEPAPAPAPEAGVKFCPVCGAKCAENAAFCCGCGGKF